MNKTPDNAFVDALRCALREDTPPAADAAIRRAMRSAVRRPRPAPRIRRWAAAAGIAAAIGIAAWMSGREHGAQRATLRDEGEVMLEIIGLASVDDVYCIN